jgi:hypothetical protein
MGALNKLLIPLLAWFMHEKLLLTSLVFEVD